MSLVGSGVIGPGGEEYFDVILTGDHTYAVYVEPVEPGVDFDLFIYDENGVLVAFDESTAPDAYCSLTPKWTGPFRLKVTSVRGVSGYRIRVLD